MNRQFLGNYYHQPVLMIHVKRKVNCSYFMYMVLWTGSNEYCSVLIFNILAIYNVLYIRVDIGNQYITKLICIGSSDKNRPTPTETKISSKLFCISWNSVQGIQLNQNLLEKWQTNCCEKCENKWILERSKLRSKYFIFSFVGICDKFNCDCDL